MQGLGVKGVHIAERDTQAGRDAKPIGMLRQHLVGGGVRLRELPAGRARLGQPRALVPAERPPPRPRAARRRSISTRRGSSPRSTPGPRRPGRSTAFSSPTTRRSRSPTITRSARATRRSTARPATMPITPATRRCCRCTRRSASGQGAGELEDPRRERDPLGRGRPRGAALRPCAERALVRLAAVDPGDPGAGAVPERDRPAGDERGHRRHGLGAGEPARRHRRDRRDGPRLLPRESSGRISGGSRRTTPTGRRSRPAGRSSPRRSTRATPGSSRTCWRPERDFDLRSGVRRGFDRRATPRQEHRDALDRNCSRAGARRLLRRRAGLGRRHGPAAGGDAQLRATAIVPPGRGTLALAVRTFVPAGETTGTRSTARAAGSPAADLFGADVVTPVRLTGSGSRPRRAAAAGGLRQRRLSRAARPWRPAFGWPADVPSGGRPPLLVGQGLVVGLPAHRTDALPRPRGRDALSGDTRPSRPAGSSDRLRAGRHVVDRQQPRDLRIAVVDPTRSRSATFGVGERKPRRRPPPPRTARCEVARIDDLRPVRPAAGAALRTRA